MNDQLQELSSTSLLSLFETTKSQRASFLQGVKEAALNGGAKPLNILLQAKCMAELAKEICDDPDLKELYLIDGEKEGKTFTYLNANFSRSEVGVKYDYSKCNDTVLDDIQAEASALADKIKARQKMLQSIPQGQELADPTNGNMLCRPSKSSTTQYIVKLL